MHSTNNLKVLFIAGAGRSGSTILGNTLDQIPGFISVGQFCDIWMNKLSKDSICGCGTHFNKCEFWNAVMSKAFQAPDEIDIHEMIRLHKMSTRTRHIPKLMFPWVKRRLVSRSQLYRDNLGKLYQAIQTQTGCKVIVDSSKLPMYGYILEQISSISMYVVHLIRDPRGIAYSWLRRELHPSGFARGHLSSVLFSCLRWNVLNLATEVFWKRHPSRYLMLRYEDFIHRPQQTIEHILNLLQEDITDLPFLTDREMELRTSHTISGNPIRFATGTMKLRLDDEWVSHLGKRDRSLVTTLTWPLLIRYKYHLVGRG